MAKVLVIDDAKFMRTVIKKIVLELGHETVEAANGREGLEKINIEKPDIVLTDIIMPEMDGTELLTLLRDLHLDGNVIVISANIQNAIKEQCLGLGVSRFFGKPPDKEGLGKAIDEILNKGKQG
jgi:CheY-like chemotaxis protein